MMSQFVHCNIVVCPRPSNRVADSLAGYGCTLQQGSVSTATPSSAEEGASMHDVAQRTKEEHGPQCSARERRPSTRVQGPGWA